MTDYSVDVLSNEYATVTRVDTISSGVEARPVIELEIEINSQVASVVSTGVLAVDVVMPSVLEQVEVEIPGLSGPAGPMGPVGQGTLTFEFLSPASSWPIMHNLGRFPSVTVIVDREVVLADVTHIDLNNLVVDFAEPQSGFALLSP
jgi:hypothetical protein